MGFAFFCVALALGGFAFTAYLIWSGDKKVLAEATEESETKDTRPVQRAVEPPTTIVRTHTPPPDDPVEMMLDAKEGIPAYGTKARAEYDRAEAAANAPTLRNDPANDPSERPTVFSLPAHRNSTNRR